MLAGRMEGCMGAIDRLFDVLRGVNPLRGRVRPVDPKAALERARQVFRLHKPVLQTPEEQAGVRHRMEAELDDQREHRARP